MKKTTAIALALLALVLVFSVGSIVFVASASTHSLAPGVAHFTAAGPGVQSFEPPDCPPSDPGCH